MSLVKVLRLRPLIADEEERLVQYSQPTGYKGGISDVRLEIYLENKSEVDVNGQPTGKSFDSFELKFIEISKNDPSNTTIGKYDNIGNQYGETTIEAQNYIIKDFIVKSAYKILVSKGVNFTDAQSKSQNYYGIVQDPWNDDPPLIRNYGNDSYFLNNGLEVKIFWNKIGSSIDFYSGPIWQNGLTGGVKYSNPDGTEAHDLTFILPGKTPSVPFIQDSEDIASAKEDKKNTIVKTLYAKPNFDLINSGKAKDESYTLSSKEIKIYTTGVTPEVFSGDVPDLNILETFITTYKNKVQNYDLKVCVPNYFPDLSLEFRSPIGPVDSSSPNADNKTPDSGSPEDVKFKLSVVYDTTIVIKSGEDMPKIDIFVGDPPADGEFIFTGEEDDIGLDEEFVETEFVGSETESLEIESEINEQSNAEAEREAEKLPPPDPNDPNPFKNAKGSGISASDKGIGYPVVAGTINFAKKYTNGIYPAKQHPDGTFVITDGVKKANLNSRHWLTPNPAYIRLLAKVSVPLANGKEKEISVHPELANLLRPAFKAIKERGLNKYIESCAGGLAVRNVTNGTRLSNHSYGFACDINSTKEGWKYGARWDVKNKKIYNGKTFLRNWNSFDEGFYEVVKIMQNYGIGWLGSMDPMHFSIHE